MTEQQIKALRAVAAILVDAVREAGPTGAPAGLMYAACLGKLSLHQFQQIMAGLVQAGKLRRDGHLYFVAE